MSGQYYWLSVLWMVAAVIVGPVAGQSQESPTVLIPSFNGGQLSPLMYGRFDYPKYQSSAQMVSNMVPLLQGPLTRRPGTRMVSEVYNSTYQNRLMPFLYSTEDAYVLAFGQHTLQFFTDGAAVLDANTYAYTLSTAYLSTEVMALQGAQNGNTMYLAHGSHPPQKLVRSAAASWTIGDVNYTTGPFLSTNTTTTTVTPSALTGSITLDASASLWSATHVGALWRVTYPAEANSTGKELIVNAEAVGTRILVRPQQTVSWWISTTADWSGTAAIQSSEDGTNWLDYLILQLGTSATSTGDFINDSDHNVYYRWAIVQWEESGFYGRLSTTGMNVDGVVRITAYVDPNEVTATVLHELLGTTATTNWAEGAWSSYRGYPQTIAFYEQRLVYGGTSSLPQTLWFTKTADGSTDDYENMQTGSLANDALVFQLPGQNPICWMQAQSYLLVGTSSAVGRLGKSDEAITAANPPAYRTQAKQGSAFLSPETLGDSLVFVERSGYKLREVQYAVQSDSYVSADLTILAQNVTSGSIVQIAAQERTNPIIWAVLSNGHLISDTFSRPEQVCAWADHTTQGTFESVCVIPGTNEDEIWVECRRHPTTGYKRFIEQLQPFDWGSDSNDCWYMDSALSTDANTPINILAVTRSATATITLTTGPYNNGDQVQMAGILGMTNLNGNVYTLKNRTASGTHYVYDLYDSTGTVRMNTTAFGGYISGGTTQRVENTFTGLSHLQGLLVGIWGNGGYIEDATVSGGSVTCTQWLDYSEPIVIGLKYTSKFQTLPFIKDMGGGILYPNRKSLTKMAIDLYQTIDPECTVEDYATASWIPIEDPFALGEQTIRPLFTGVREVDLASPRSRTPSLWIRTNGPNPLMIRSLAVTIDVSAN